MHQIFMFIEIELTKNKIKADKWTKNSLFYQSKFQVIINLILKNAKKF